MAAPLAIRGRFQGTSSYGVIIHRSDDTGTRNRCVAATQQSRSLRQVLGIYWRRSYDRVAMATSNCLRGHRLVTDAQ